MGVLPSDYALLLTLLRIIGWGWYFLSTILDDYSRYIISWRLTTTMAASDVTDTLEDALKATGLTEARVHHKPRLLSDNMDPVISQKNSGSGSRIKT
jgi:putative transposase